VISPMLNMVSFWPSTHSMENFLDMIGNRIFIVHSLENIYIVIFIFEINMAGFESLILPFLWSCNCEL
jgi:hypothetical protein